MQTTHVEYSVLMLQHAGSIPASSTKILLVMRYGVKFLCGAETRCPSD